MSPSHDASAAGADTPLQRRYTAACPQCGAAVSFSSLASTHAVCSYCKSTVVRHGDALERIGEVAELFEDFSGLALGDRGQYDGVGFSLIGRLQYEGEAGRWTEWVTLLDNQESAILSEDNGAFVWATPCEGWLGMPSVGLWQLGASYNIRGNAYEVSSVQQARLFSAQGELPKLPAPDQRFEVIELRGNDDVISVDCSQNPPLLMQAQATDLQALRLRGKYAAPSEAKVTGRAIECTRCGAGISLQLAMSRSVSCPNCHSVVQVLPASEGAAPHGQGYFAFESHAEPDIPLGSKGKLDGKTWQIVGFQDREGSDGESGYVWHEYVLYNSQKGFGFLVDSEDGWSWVRTTTGAPKMVKDKARYLGVNFTRRDAYTARTLSVCGEFYWPIKKDDRSFNIDFSNGEQVLYREQSKGEVVWSVGRQISAVELASVFGVSLQSIQRKGMSPWNGAWSDVSRVVLLVVLGLFVALMAVRCDDACQSRYNPYSTLSREEQLAQCHRSYGGGGGGYGGGGGHK